MRKKVLSAALSIIMLATSFTPVLGAEFSSGEVIETIPEERKETNQEVIFDEQSGYESSEEVDFKAGDFADNETEELSMPEDSSEYEVLGSESEELADVFQSEDEIADLQLLQAATEINSAEEIQTDVLYSGDTIETEYGEYLQWYKFTAQENGTYSLGCRILSESGYVCIGTKEDYENGNKESFDTDSDTYINLTLKKGEVYYIKIESYEISKFSLLLRSPKGTLAGAQEIVEGKTYGRTNDMFYSNWYKFVPKKSGDYVISADEADVSVYLSNKLDTPVAPLDDNRFHLSGNETYYIKADAYIEDTYNLSVKREITDIDCIQEILERQGALPQLNEIENEKAVTAAKIYEEYGNQKTFMQFIPKKTGRYNIKLYQKDDKYQNPISSLMIYDTNFKMVENTFTLKQGCSYYITNAYAYMDLSNCVFMTEYTPTITSLKLLEEPKYKVLYKDCGVTPYASEGWLSGIKLEVVYDNGKKEIISTDNGIKPKTSYGEYLTGSFDGEKQLYELVSGKYTFTIYPMYDKSKSVKINNIEVKERKDLPLYTTTGSISVNTTWEGSAYIRFKPRTTGRYVISSSSKGDVSVQKDNLDTVIFGTKSTVEVTLEAGKSYYITSGIQGDKFVWGNKLTFTIKAAAKTNLSKSKITVPSSVSYTGKALTPAVTIQDGTVKLKKGTDYTLSYSKNTKIGTATVTIKGKGNYTGTVKKNFKIVPGTPKLGKVTSAGNNKLKITWNKVTGATGYIIQRYDSGKWVTKKTLTGSKILTYTDTTVKKGTTYKYRIAAYTTVNKKKVLSAYSAVKSGKC